MTQSIRTAVVLAAAATLLAGPTLAQTASSAQSAQAQNRPATAPATGGAAATLPNAFDAPKAATSGAAPAPAPASAPASPAASQVAENTLRSVIEQFAAGNINEAMFTPEVASRLNTNLAEYRSLIRGFGPLESIQAQAVSDGLGQFLVIFEEAATQWQLGLNEAGLVAALRFRETPPESSEPPSPTARPGANARPGT